MRCDCPTTRIPGVPGFPSTDRYVKDHAPDCGACRECDDGYRIDRNGARWRCGSCSGSGKRKPQVTAGGVRQ